MKRKNNNGIYDFLCYRLERAYEEIGSLFLNEIE